MKFAPVIFCLLLCSISLAQRRDDFKSLVLGEYNYPYDAVNSNFYYEQAKSLTKLNNPDSSHKASKIMWGLYLYDTSRYKLEDFVPLLKKIERSNTHYYERVLKGKWRFSHDWLDGLGYIPIDSIREDTFRVVEFDGHNAAFFFKDSLYRKTSYTIECRHTGFEFQRINIFSICFHDSDAKWWFTINPEYMKIKHEYYCSCGCVLSIYKKIQDVAPLVVHSE